MKNLFKVVLLAIAIMLPSFNASAKKTLERTWVKIAVNGREMPSNVISLKAIRADHTIINLESFNGGTTFTPLNSGTWQKIADGVYMETTTSFTPGAYQDLSVPITYEFGKNNVMTIHYNWNGQIATEQWAPYKKK